MNKDSDEKLNGKDKLFDILDENQPSREEIQQFIWTSLEKSEKRESVIHVVHPESQAILENDTSSAQKVSSLIDVYLAGGLPFEKLAEEFMHPSVLALHADIQPWLILQCGDDMLRYWSLLFAAAKEWFSPSETSLLANAFFFRFEMEDLTWWNGRSDFQPLVEEYLRWREGL